MSIPARSYRFEAEYLGVPVDTNLCGALVDKVKTMRGEAERTGQRGEGTIPDRSGKFEPDSFESEVGVLVLYSEPPPPSHTTCLALILLVWVAGG